jgi:glutathione S-transferase
VRLTSRLLGYTISEVNVAQQINATSDDKKDSQPLAAKKSLTGKFPVLETSDGHTIMEGLSIAKFLGRQRDGFYGFNDLESKTTIDPN